MAGLDDWVKEEDKEMGRVHYIQNSELNGTVVTWGFLFLILNRK